MTDETYEKLQAELSQLLNTEKYKRMTSKDMPDDNDYCSRGERKEVGNGRDND